MAVMANNKDAKNSMDTSKYVRYTSEQVEALERVYSECPKPSSLRRQHILESALYLPVSSPSNQSLILETKVPREAEEGGLKASDPQGNLSATLARRFRILNLHSPFSTNNNSQSTGNLFQYGELAVTLLLAV